MREAAVTSGLIATLVTLGGVSTGAEIDRVIDLDDRRGPQLFGAYAVLPDPATDQVFVAAAGSGRLAAIDPRSGRILRTIPLTPGSSWAGYQYVCRDSPSLVWAWGRKLLVGMHRGLWLIDPDSMTVLAHQSWQDWLVGPLCVHDDLACVVLSDANYFDCSLALLERDTLRERHAQIIPGLSPASVGFPSIMAWEEVRQRFVGIEWRGYSASLPRVHPNTQVVISIDPHTYEIATYELKDDRDAGAGPLVAPRRLMLESHREDPWRLSWSAWDDVESVLGSVVPLVKHGQVWVVPGHEGMPEWYTPFESLFGAIWSPNADTCATFVTGNLLLLIGAAHERILGAVDCTHPVGDLSDGTRPKVWADWARGRIYMSHQPNNSLSVLSARDLSLLGHWQLGTSIWRADFDPWNGLLSIVGQRHGNVAWGIDRKLNVQHYGPRKGLQWLAFDAHRGWVYTNAPCLHGSHGFLVKDVHTGEVIREVRYLGRERDTGFSPEDTVRHVYAHPRFAPDPVGDVFWRLNEKQTALEALHTASGDVIDTVRIRRSRELAEAYPYQTHIAVDPRRRLAYVSVRLPDKTGLGLWEVGLDSGRSRRLPDVGVTLGALAVCPRSGWLVGGDPAGNLVFLGPESQVVQTLSPSTPDRDRATAPARPSLYRPGRLEPFADFKRGRVLVVDEVEALVYAVVG